MLDFDFFDMNSNYNTQTRSIIATIVLKEKRKTNNTEIYIFAQILDNKPGETGLNEMVLFKVFLFIFYAL